MVDGNGKNFQLFSEFSKLFFQGVLHMRNFGSACHLGVLSGIPCMGIAKKLLYTDGITDQRVAESLRNSKPSKFADLYGDSGKRLAIAFKSPPGNTLYISVGHRIDLDTCAELVKSCMLPGHALPEPVHQVNFFCLLFGC
jgi:deoxyinosine 3'endonuclease (endonuclease V)